MPEVIAVTLVDDDISAARRAARTLEQAAAALVRHYGDTLDVRRLQADVGRVTDDLDLLCGKEPAVTPAPPPPVPREVIPDTEYAHDFWMDAEDEGLGYSGHGR